MSIASIDYDHLSYLIRSKSESGRLNKSEEIAYPIDCHLPKSEQVLAFTRYNRRTKKTEVFTIRMDEYEWEESGVGL